MERNLRMMESFCTGVTCRHRALVEHFGQTYEADNCNACDVCLNQQATLPDALVVAQKILSCVVRVNENFGGDYVAQVLVGSTESRILENGHDRLSTYGLLKEQRKTTVREWIEQLCGQDYIAREGEYRILKVTATGREVLRGQRTPRLLAAEKRSSGKKSELAVKGKKNFSEGMDAGLFEALRVLRRHLAEEAGVPPYVVFGDVTLQDLSRRRPTTLENFRLVHGVGEHKAKQYAEPFLAEISRYCAEHGVSTDVNVFAKSAEQQALEAFRDSDKTSSKIAAATLFREGKSLAEVAQQLGRANSTVTDYLATFLEEEGYLSPEPWVDGGTYAAVVDIAQEIGTDKLRPILDRLGGNVSYDQIRIALACFRNHQPATE
jgi:ATP-dependent DNA helicase RecQ